MKTTTDTKSAITIVDRANSWLQNTIFSTLSLPLAMHFHQWWTKATHHLTVLTVPRNFQQASMNVSGCSCFHMEESNSTPSFHTHFHVRHHFVRLPLCCHLSHGNRMWRNTGGKIQPLLPYHHHLPLMASANQNGRHYFWSSLCISAVPYYILQPIWGFLFQYQYPRPQQLHV